MTKSLRRVVSAFAVVLMGGAALESEAQPWAGADGCMHGGKGSDECAFSFNAGLGYGCSVSCLVGYYACCKGTGCNCVRESKAKR
jgi:hypothetical protein